MTTQPRDQNRAAADAQWLDAIKSLPELAVPEGATARFDARLTRALWRRRLWRRMAMAAAAAVIGVTGAAVWWAGPRGGTGVSGQLQSPDATARLSRVIDISQLPQVDSQAIADLRDVLLNDRSTGVRLAAAETLEHHASAAELRDAVQAAIARETSPFVLSALLSAIESLPEANQKALLDQFLAREDLDDVLRQAAKAARGL